MLNEETNGEAKQNPARDRYAGVAGQQLREATECRFSFLPYTALVQISGSWYDAAADAMLRGNYGPVEDWVRDQAKIAASQGFELEDLLQLMKLCRQIAIEREGWVEDQMEAIDEIIDEALAAMSGQVKWVIPEGLQYVTGKSAADRAAEKDVPMPTEPGKEEPVGERRVHKRAYLKLPIRVRGWAGEQVEEVVKTDNVARGGVCFLSEKDYAVGLKIQVIYPYWGDAAGNKEYPAEVVRVTDHEEGKAVAIKFLVSLGK